MAPGLAVIVVGVGGNLGPSIVRALLAQKGDFRRIAILSAPEKKTKFTQYEAQGMELVLGDYKDSKSYKGIPTVWPDCSENHVDVTRCRFRRCDLSLRQRYHARPISNDRCCNSSWSHAFLSLWIWCRHRPRAFQGRKILQRQASDTQSSTEERKRGAWICCTYIIIAVFGETFTLTPVFGVDREKKEFTFFRDQGG